MLQRIVWLVALSLCLGQAAASAHLHLDQHDHDDEHEEEVCTLCGLSDPGHILDVKRAGGQPYTWRLTHSVPVFLVVLSPRPFEFSRSRVPPIS